MNLESLFQAWGETNRKFPPNNQTIKNLALSKYSSLDFKPSIKKPDRPWLPLSFAALALLFFLFPLFKSDRFSSVPAIDQGTPSSISQSGFALDSKYGSAKEQEEVRLFNPNSGIPITDVREFIKTNYSATIQTRKVEKLTTRLQTTIRGFDGRVDTSNSSPKFGYINFIVPASKFESFKREVRTLVPGKFYFEQVNTQNLLPQKQTIEQRQQEAEASLASLLSEREKLNEDHDKAVNSIWAQINSARKNLETLRSEITGDPVRQAEIDTQIDQLVAEEKNLQSRLYVENKNYQADLEDVNARIQSAETRLANVKKQDQDLVDNVATINGSISLNWISVWKMLDLYVPGNLVAWILALVALASYFITLRLRY